VLTLNAVTTNQSGCTYWVEVTNSYGAVTSAVAALTVFTVPTLGEALNAPQLVWTNGGNLPWVIQTTNTHDGSMAAQSGAITHSQESWVQTTVTGPGQLSFWWSVSSDTNSDFLELQTNEVLATRISGTVAWQQESLILDSGAYVLRWRYVKDGSTSVGHDRGYLDEVSFIGAGNNPPIVANPLPDANGRYGTPFIFTFTANTFSDPDAGQTLSYSASGLPSGLSFDGGTRTFSGTPTALGTSSVTVTATDNGSPPLSTNDVFEIVIGKAPLTATADNKSRTYAEPNPSLTFGYSGFVLGEDAAVLDTPPVAGTTAANGSPVGPYPITLSGGADDHYEFGYVSGTLTITPSPLTVTADSTNRVYGTRNPALTGALVGVVTGDAITATFSTSADTNSAPGPYPITPSLTDPDNKLGNYAVTTNAGTLTVEAAPLTVTANDTNRLYGAINPVLTGSIAGLVNGDIITATFSASADTNSPLGTYPITPALVDPDTKLGNYTVTTNAGTLTVTTAPLTVTANDTNRLYGTVNPDFTGSLLGLVNGDNITATFTTTATIDSPPGTYPITPLLTDTDNKLGNYAVTTNAGTLTVTSPPELSISQGGGGLITLSWPSVPAGFVLESADNLTPPVVWQEVTSGIVENGGIKSYTVTNDPSVASRLYRLRLQ
jgi:hypothetical protein